MKFASGAALILLLLPAIATAQSIDPTGSVPTLTLDLSPTDPAPYGTLTITPESSVIDLANATVTISVNGTQVSSGNAASVSVTLPGPGVETDISATATLGGQQYSATATLFPGAVALIEEPLASVPALYPGSPLVPEGGSVRIVAIPDFETVPGRQVSPSSLSYTWTQDGSILNSASGIGDDAIIIDAPLEYRSTDVSVAVQTQDGNVTGGATLTIESQPPTLRLYDDDPLEGILFDNALSGTYNVGTESTLVAVPYSFTTDNGPPTTNWFLSGSAAESGDTITLRPTGSGGGTDSLSANTSAAGTNYGSTASLSLSFGSSGASGLFGL